MDHNPVVDAAVQLAGGEWLLLSDPVRILEAHVPEAVAPTLEAVEQAARAHGLHAAGFLSYEAGAAFGLPAHEASRDVPLAWFALFEEAATRRSRQIPSGNGYALGTFEPSVDRAAFDCGFQKIKDRIAAGDTYQVNYTFRLDGPFRGDPRSLFADLVAAQGSRHSTYISAGELAVCSASPELFFERAPARTPAEPFLLTTRPMKGTVRRGRTVGEDAIRCDGLQASAKQRAENVMIVDMMRNDLGRIAEIGSVQVPEMFAVERYPNVWQMTSTVVARSSAPLADVFAALHPSASVTGAPKVSTMDILRQLEGAPRGIYTGAVGWVAPDGAARFSVAIRTAVVHLRRGRVEFGVGSGIVWDSDAAEEYDECLAKASVLGRSPARFELLETMRCDSGGCFLIGRHLARLKASAEYFGFEFSEEAVRRELGQVLAGVEGPQRVRVLVAESGATRVERSPLAPTATPLRVALASGPVDARDPFLFHKTTHRAVYDRLKLPDTDETILWNHAGEVTEAITANVVVELGGKRVTPPVGCGLLAGTFRGELLARGEVEERVVTREDLGRAARIWLINSVHEWRPAILVLLACIVLMAAQARAQPASVPALTALMRDEAVKSALSAVHRDESRTLADQIRFCEVPAPPFEEAARGNELRRAFAEAGLRNVRVDAAGNVLGDLPGRTPRPHLVVASHLDTVFPAGTNVKVSRDGHLLRGPGIGDNCRGLAVLVAVARALRQSRVQTPGPITFVANVGEEGLGDLRGVRQLFSATLDGRVDRFLSIDGGGRDGRSVPVTHVAVGSHRYRMTFKGPGGHSFGAFGEPNPAGALGRAIAKIQALQVPSTPRTTFNIGRIGGGTSVNAIPFEAWMEVDLRSSDSAALDALDARVRQAVDQAVAEENERWGRRGGVTVTKELVGDRPAGVLPVTSPIVRAAQAAAEVLGLVAALSEGSTDANLPISLGIPAVTIGGGGAGSDAHALDETFDSRDAWRGVQHALLLTVALAHP